MFAKKTLLENKVVYSDDFFNPRHVGFGGSIDLL